MVERGVDLYAAGDLAGARREFEAALKLDPKHARAAEYLGWVRDLLAGRKSLGRPKALDDDAVRAVAEALGSEFGEAPTVARPSASAAPASQSPATPPAARSTPPAARSTPPAARSTPPAARSTPPVARPPTAPGLKVARPPTTSLNAQWDEVSLVPDSMRPAAADSEAPGAPVAAPPGVTAPASAATIPPFAPPARNAPTSTPSASTQPPFATPSPAATLAASAPADPSRRSGFSMDDKSGARRTMLGMPPPTNPRMIKPAAVDVTPVPEEPEQVTREWRQSATGQNLPPLDVPEISDAQLVELSALDRDIAAAGSRAAAPAPLEPETSGRLIELTAEPTPLPERSPFEEEQVVNAADAMAAADAAAAAAAPIGEDDYEAFEAIPTRERGASPEAGARRRISHDGDEPSQVTNPFIRSRLGDYAPAAPPPPVELPPLPPLPGARTMQEGPPQMAAALERVARGDAKGALESVEGIVNARGGLDACKDIHPILEHVYRAVVGDLALFPRHGVVGSDLDPRSAFLLSRIDGSTSADDLLEVSGMPRLEALRTLASMVARGIVLMS